MSDNDIVITRLTKAYGPLTKRIMLGPDDKAKSDGSACTMSKGTAERLIVHNVDELTEIIGQLGSNQALALGALQGHHPDHVEVVTKQSLTALNGSAAPNIIARTSDYISYRSGTPSFVLLDFDSKGMPPAVAECLNDLGGFWSALVSVIPEFAAAARVSRRSTSAGLYRRDTGQKLHGSDGWHVFVALQDGPDAERFLKTLHDRCMLAGLGWMMLGAGGQLLERSIVDRMVGAPERLVFEGAPILEPPLAQDPALRLPVPESGVSLASMTACPPLTILEKAKLREVRAKETQRLQPDSQKARQIFIAEQAVKLAGVEKTSPEQAQRIVARQCEGVLLPNVTLQFDNPDLAGCTVADILADPQKFTGETLADPLEGIEYGACKAKIMIKPDGRPWINSFAHGRTVYELRYDAQAVIKALDAAQPDQAVDTFARMTVSADLSDDELETLTAAASRRSNIGVRAILRRLKKDRADQTSREAENHRAHAMATRRDPRPQIVAPLSDSPWLPQMQLLNDVLAASKEVEPPMRDVEGVVTTIRDRPVSNMHALTSANANDGEAAEQRQSAPAQPLLTRLNETQLAEMIERYIDFTDDKGRSVHLNGAFVKHYLQRDDGKLPIVSIVATLPLILPNGETLAGVGLMRDRGIVFRIPPAILKALPRQEECTASAVARAMRFLCDEWLVDVAADFPGKCIIVASVLSIIERPLFPERPAFFFVAGQRGGGKTTLTNAVTVAATGHRASAAAWSPNDEERRKAVMSYLAEGGPVIAWDNIPRGVAISCPTIEKVLTAETYTDRILGVMEKKTVPASTVMLFTGNNISPRGDMASRSLTVRLSVDRPDPENRVFKHPDVVKWTETNRPEILSALYTILLGNPRLRELNPSAAETRFKAWWHLVGAAVENAAKEFTAHAGAMTIEINRACAPAGISFRKLFLDGEQVEEQTGSLASLLDSFRTEWPNGAMAAEIARHVIGAGEQQIAFREALEQARGKALKMPTAHSVAWHLKALVDAPVLVGEQILALKFQKDAKGGTFLVKPTCQ